MSSIGTGVATSVAQVAQNAQQSAKARDKARTDGDRAAHAHATLAVARLQAPGAATDADAELPDRQAPGYEQLYFTDPHGQPLAPPLLDAASLPPGHDPSETILTYGPHAEPTYPLYQHLDIRG